MSAAAEPQNRPATDTLRSDCRLASFVRRRSRAFMIPLQNLQQQQIGFLLPAGLPDDFRPAVGEWEGDCIFMALPTQSELFDDPAFHVLADHKEAGEHRTRVSNDGSTLSAIALAPNGAELFVHLPDSGPGAWGTRAGSTGTQLGYAVRVSNRSA